MGKDRSRRQGISANGSATVNTRAKGCFGKSNAEKKGYKPMSLYKMKQAKKAYKAGKK
jgi:hypothetical protein